MKSWLITYSVKYDDGTEEERKMTVEAVNLFDAYMIVHEKVQCMIGDWKIKDAVIWDVGIIDDYVW